LLRLLRLPVAWMRVAVLPFAVSSFSIAFTACKPSSDRSSSADAGAAASGHLVVLLAPGNGSVAPLVREAASRAAAGGRTLVVYVGASWCEPCERFRRAAENGDLDSSFPTLTLLEFDFDRDSERLRSAGYVSELIPLFALPASDGSASGRQVSGGIKGEGAVSFIAPRLAALLAP
jgi:hypothetical protein